MFLVMWKKKNIIIAFSNVPRVTTLTLWHPSNYQILAELNRKNEIPQLALHINVQPHKQTRKSDTTRDREKEREYNIKKKIESHCCTDSSAYHEIPKSYSSLGVCNIENTLDHSEQKKKKKQDLKVYHHTHLLPASAYGK